MQKLVQKHFRFFILYFLIHLIKYNHFDTVINVVGCVLFKRLYSVKKQKQELLDHLWSSTFYVLQSGLYWSIK